MRLRLGLLLMTACGANVTTARHFGAQALRCPEQDVDAEMLVHDVFEVSGCGRTAVLECPERELCTAVEEGEVPDAPRSVGPSPSARPSPPSATTTDSSESLASPREREGSSPPSR